MHVRFLNYRDGRSDYLITELERSKVLLQDLDIEYLEGHPVRDRIRYQINRIDKLVSGALNE